MSSHMGALFAVAVIALIVAAFSITGEMSYRDALAEERTACLMVARGYWPAAQAEGFNCPERVAGVER